MLALIALQLTHIHKQITSHKTDAPFGESAHKQGKSDSSLIVHYINNIFIFKSSNFN